MMTGKNSLRFFFILIAVCVLVISPISRANADYTCGDANNDQMLNLFDVVFLITYLYLDGPAPAYFEAADVNMSGTLNIFDITYLINSLYLDGPEPCDPIPDGQVYCFDVSYVSFAFGPEFYGIYVNNEGKVYYYNNGGILWSPAQWGIYTQAELDVKYGHLRFLIDSVSISELLEKYSLIEPASLGPYSDSTFGGYDAGQLTYEAYMYNKNTLRYISVPLHLRGTTIQDNLSPSAVILYQWLRTFDLSPR